MKKRHTLFAAIAVCLVAVLAMGSLAYFTANKESSNSFRMAVYDPNNPDAPVNPDQLFSIKLTETGISTVPGVINGATNGNGGMIYTDVAPGLTYAKDPKVENTGKYDQWVRVKVTFTKYNAWKAAMQKYDATRDKELDVALLGGISNAWTKGTAQSDTVIDTTADTITYTYYLNTALAAANGSAPAGTSTLFTTFTFPETFSVEDISTLPEFKINLVAEAIQAAHTGSSAIDAFRDYWR